jgi:hypothetical protein
MSQVEPNLDLRIAIPVDRGPVDIEENPQGPLTWHQALLLGTVALGRKTIKGPSSLKLCSDLARNNMTTV